MPRYRTNLFTGELEEVEFEGSHRSVVLNGRMVRVDALDEAHAFMSSGLNGGKMWESRAMAVHPSEVEAKNREMAAHGINVEYQSNGRPRTNSKRARNELFKHHKCFDRDACYGDYAGQ